MDRDLSAEELRVLGSLIEKEATTPEQYPLSVNALISACNQKSNREPVMGLSEADVRAAIGSLTRRGLVRAASGYGGRVSKYGHRFGAQGSGLELSTEETAVLCVLFLRGPQTPGELRARTQRLHAFADTAAVQHTLSALEQHPEGPLVCCLPRQPGTREHRYAHCFAAAAAEADSDGTTEADAAPGSAELPLAQADDRGDLESRVAALEQAMAAMEERIARLPGEQGGGGADEA